METEILLKKKIMQVPKLRFGEFNENWISTKLSKVAKIERGRFSPRPRNNPIYYGGKIPFVQTSDVVNCKGQILNYSQTLNEKGLKVSKQFDKGTILITIAANIGYSGVLQVDMACPDSLIGISCHDNIFNYFLNYQLEIEQPRMDYLAVAAAQKNINIEFLKPYKFNIPSLPEQQKIASFLSAVDKKIEQLTRKKELLETYKKGVMKQLFSQEIRFMDEHGKDFSNWKEKRLKEFICDFIVPMRDKPKDLTGEIPWCRIEDFDGKYLYNSKSKQGVTLETIKAMNLKVYPINTLIVSCSANLGFCAIVKKELVTNQTFIGLVPNSEKIDIDFLYHKMKYSSRRLNVLSSGTTISYLSRKQFENFKIDIPTIKEQQKIANLLSAIDKKIEAVSQQITQTQSFKKGLLQQMFV